MPRSMPIPTNDAPRLLPSSIKSLHYLIRQWSFFQVDQILFEMVCATRPNDHGISMFALEQTMMGHPAYGTLRFSQTMLFRDWAQNVQSVKHGLIPISASVCFSLPRVRVEATALFNALVKLFSVISVC